MEIRYPPEPLPGESRQAWEARALRPWRLEIKRQLLDERGWTCERCGQPSRVLDLDEAVIPRSQMPRDPVRRRLAFGEPCLLLSCPTCNREQAHDVETAWRLAVARYGRATVEEWYEGIGLKAPRREWR